MRFSMLIPASLLFLATACVGDVGEDKVAATVVDAPTEAGDAAAAQAVAKTLKVDVSQSKIHILGAKITATHDIGFDSWKGELQLDANGDLVGLAVTVDMKSVNSDAEKLTEHLRTNDFFSVDEFPSASFKSSSVEAKPGEDGATHVVTGDLSLRGVTKRVTFPATVAKAGEGVHAKTEFVVNRKDFNIQYPGMPDDLIQDNVVLTIDLKG